MGSIASQLFFLKDDFGIKYPTKVDMTLNKETKPIYVSLLVDFTIEMYSKTNNEVVLDTHTQIHAYMYIYIYIYIGLSVSSLEALNKSLSFLNQIFLEEKVKIVTKFYWKSAGFFYYFE